MKRHLIAAAAATILIALPSLASAESRTLDVEQFHAVSISTGIDAVVAGGMPHSVVAEASDKQALDDLRFDVREGVLYLWYDWNVLDLFTRPPRDIKVTIGTEVLDRLEASAGASIAGSGLMGEEIDLEATSGAFIRTEPIEGMDYDIEATSGARIETSGLCTDADVEVTTGASVGARALECTKVELEVTTGASLEITAKGSVDAEVTTGAHATVFGKPTVDHLETSTGGSVDFPG
jgi:hypothetical protein